MIKIEKVLKNYGDLAPIVKRSRVFGGFSKKFYEAYQATYPLDHTYDDVKPLYQLYYLIVHLNMFAKIVRPSS